MSRIAVVLCLVALTQVCAEAEEHQTSKVYAACLDKSGGVTFAMQACVADEFERQDKRLNAAYKALIGAVSEKRRLSCVTFNENGSRSSTPIAVFMTIPKVEQLTVWPPMSAASPTPPYAPRSYKTSRSRNNAK